MFSRSRTGSTYANALLIRSPPLRLTGNGATPTVSSRSLKSSTAGIPLATIASMHTLWNGVSSVDADDPYAELLPGEIEQRQQVLGGPAGIAGGRPRVVVEAAPVDDGAGVMR